MINVCYAKNGRHHPLSREDFAFTGEEEKEVFITHCKDFLKTYKDQFTLLQPDTIIPHQMIITKIFTGGRSGAKVFKADLCYQNTNETITHTRILKYDTAQRIAREKQNWETIASGKLYSFFPHYDCDVHFSDGMAFVSLADAREAVMADEIYTVIHYIIQKYHNDAQKLAYYAESIGLILSDIFHILAESFYRRIRVNDTDIVTYYKDKIQKADPGLQEITHDNGKCADDLQADWAQQEEALNAIGTLEPTRAIHGDLNPGNILLCIGRNGKIFPLIIDFGEVAYTDDTHNDFHPLFWDTARLEGGIILSFFDHLSDTGALSIIDLRILSPLLLTVLAGGQDVFPIVQGLTIEQQHTLSYLFTIIKIFRKNVFNHTICKHIDQKKLCINYLYSVYSFYRFFLKWKKEKKPVKQLSLLLADTLLHQITDKDLNYSVIVTPSGKQVVYNDNFSYILSGIKQHYIPITTNITKICDFITHNSCGYFYISGYMGGGKTLFASFLTGLFNKEILIHHQLPDFTNTYAFPYFISEYEHEKSIIRSIIMNINETFPIKDFNADMKFEHYLNALYNERLQAENENKIIICIDGIDLNFAILDEIAPAYASLPQGIYLLLFGRENCVYDNKNIISIFDACRNKMGLVKESHYHFLDNFNKEEITAFFAMYLPEHKLPSDDELQWIMDKSQGLPIYINMLNILLQRKNYSFNEIRRYQFKDLNATKDSLSRNIFELYELYLTDLYSAFAEQEFHLVRTVYALLCALPDGIGITVIQIKKIGDLLHPSLFTPVLMKILHKLSNIIHHYFNENNEECYRLYHQSFKEYITAYEPELIEDVRKAIGTYCSGWPNAPDNEKHFILKLYPLFLAEQKDWRSLKTLLLQVSFITAKIVHGMTADLVRDYYLVKSHDINKEETQLHTDLIQIGQILFNNKSFLMENPQSAGTQLYFAVSGKNTDFFNEVKETIQQQLSQENWLRLHSVDGPDVLPFIAQEGISTSHLYIHHIHFSPDSTIVIFITKDGITRWNWQTSETTTVTVPVDNIGDYRYGTVVSPNKILINNDTDAWVFELPDIYTTDFSQGYWNHLIKKDESLILGASSACDNHISITTKSKADKSGINQFRIFDKKNLSLLGTMSIPFESPGYSESAPIINYICWSSDYTMKAVCLINGSVIISNGDRINAFSGGVFHAEFFDNNTKLAMCGKEPELKIYDLKTREVKAYNLQTKEAADALAICDKNKYIALAHRDGSITIFDYHNTIQKQCIFPGVDGWVLSLQFSPCGTYLAVAGRNARIKIFDIHSLTTANPLFETGQIYNTVKYSNIFTTHNIYTFFDIHNRVYSSSKQANSQILPFTCLTYCNDNKRNLIIAFHIKKLFFIEPVYGEMINEYPLDISDVRKITISEKGDHIALLTSESIHTYVIKKVDKKTCKIIPANTIPITFPENIHTPKLFSFINNDKHLAVSFEPIIWLTAEKSPKGMMYAEPAESERSPGEIALFDHKKAKHITSIKYKGFCTALSEYTIDNTNHLVLGFEHGYMYIKNPISPDQNVIRDHSSFVGLKLYNLPDIWENPDYTYELPDGNQGITALASDETKQVLCAAFKDGTLKVFTNGLKEIIPAVTISNPVTALRLMNDNRHTTLDILDDGKMTNNHPVKYRFVFKT